MVRTDRGTENTLMAAMQCYLRQDGTDAFAGAESHRYGSSPANQRIECWWSFFRRGRGGSWIDFFKDMSATGILEIGNMLHMECLWFCFQPVISTELERVREHWNTHRIRSSRMHGHVSGVPNILYYLPDRSGAIECKYGVDDESIAEMERMIVLEDDHDDNIYQEYFHYVLEEENLVLPSTQADAFELFQTLINFAENRI